MIRVLSFFVLFSLNIISLFGQNICQSDNNLVGTLKLELKEYVDQMKEAGNEFTNSFMVYTVSIHTLDKHTNSLCFSIGYIMNDFDLIYNNFQWALFEDNEIILFKSKSNLDSAVVRSLGLNIIDSANKKIIADKLLNEEKGAFTYEPVGYVYCQDENGVIKKYYENTLEMPTDRSIHEPIPFPLHIELIKEGDNKMEK